MSIENIKAAKERAEAAWAKLVNFNKFASHFGGKTQATEYYPLVRIGEGAITLVCCHPDRYGNRFNETKISVSATDLMYILERDTELADRLFDRYKDLLSERHSAYVRSIQKEKANAIAAIESI
jgi:hypothetical protein